MGHPTFASTRSRITLIAAVGLTLLTPLAALGSANSEPARARKASSAFIVKGEIAAQLSPGARSSVKVSLANRKTQTIWIKTLRMSMSIDAAHAAAGCSIERDFRVVQIPRNAFPMRLVRARSSKRSLAGKRKRPIVRWRAITTKKADGLPAIEMLDLPDVNQDACKGATLNLKFTGKATNKKPKRKKRTRR